MRTFTFAALVSLVFVPFDISLAETLPKKVNFDVPQIWEIPDGKWVKPWNGACEESSIEMINQFYLKTYTGTIPNATGKKLMAPLFPIADKLFGSNSDESATRTLKLVNDYMMYSGTLKYHPTLEDIKTELAAGHPVISFHYGYDLNNPHHAFRRGGSSYHVMVITGYDDTKGIFLVNDPELSWGLDYPYTYDTILSTLHDFNHDTHKADGDPVVLFTRPTQLVKTATSARVYLIRDGQKQHITSIQAFKNHGWSLKNLRVVAKSELDKYPAGANIDN